MDGAVRPGSAFAGSETPACLQGLRERHPTQGNLGFCHSGQTYFQTITSQVAQQKSEQQEAAKACNLKSGFAALVML
ncbi:hypothetical protein ABBQ38_005665 [Trebouxia sp. C0009 RCD-2024]